MTSDRLIRYIKGESHLFERIAVCRWVSASDENMRELESLRSIHAALAMTEDLPAMSTDTRRGFRYSLALAAIACAAVAVFTQWPGGSTIEPVQTEDHLYVASDSGNMNIILPDGSNVTLSAGSRLIFSDADEDERSAKLEGEGFFEVAPNHERPFVIDVDDVTVTVLGTKFNVSNSGNQVEVMLETGSVEVESVSDTTRMIPGQKYTYDRVSGDVTISAMAPEEYRSIECTYLVFDSAPVSAVLSRISEAFEIPIVSDIPAGKDKLLSGRMDLSDGFEKTIANVGFIVPLSGEFHDDGRYYVKIK